MNVIKKSSSFIVLAGIILLFIGCEKKDDPNLALKMLYGQYKNGSIDECTLNGQKVFTAALNGYDVQTTIYNMTATKIGQCNPAYGQVDSICSQLQDCETVYRCSNHVSGLPFIDKHHISQ
jgi:hypothetical protein